MPVARHKFSKLDVDSDLSVAPTDSFQAAVNIALNPGFITAATGNVLVPYALPPVVSNARLGGFEDGSTGTAISLLHNGGGLHRILRYDPMGNGGAGSETTLLEWSGLNLTPNMVLQGGIVDGLLVFLDGKGEMRSVNLLRAANGEYTPAALLADPYLLHLVPQPPAYAPVVARATVPATVPESAFLLVQDKAYQFCLRWRYTDGGVTPFGPKSDWLDVIEAPDTTLFNAIQVTLPLTPAPPLVQEIEVLAREAGSVNFQVARTLRRVAGAFPLSMLFYGVMEGGVPTTAEQTKLFESLWPARSMAIARSRIFAADFLEGYPTPAPAFTAIAQVGDQTVVSTNVYLVHLTFNQRARTGVAYANRAYILTSNPAVANYPDPASTYKQLYLVGDAQDNVVGYYPNPDAVTVSYAQAFTTPEPLETSRAISTLGNVAGTFVRQNNGTTFLPRSTYPVAVQYYDAQGRLGGASVPISVFIPSPPAPGTYQRIRWSLGTTDPLALNAEIPAWAQTYQIVVGQNTRASWFAQGRAADVLSYFGEATSKDTTGATLTTSVLKDRTLTHDKLFVDIGGWPAAGQGYVWSAQSGDVLRFVNEKIDCKITGQRGDYLEVTWRGAPLDSEPLIEIYTPASTARTTLYERGPRYDITRTGAGSANGGEQRGYATTTGLLDGDCFIGQANFASLTSAVLGSATYTPPAIKTFGVSSGPITITRTMPLYRAIRGSTPSASGPGAVGALDGTAAAEFERLRLIDQATGRGGRNSTSDTAPLVTTLGSTVSAALNQGASIWLDMAYGGRPTQVVPPAQQQVRRKGLIRFSGVKVQGTLLNGLSQWEPLSQYDEIPQEQGAITRLTVADQTSTDGSIMLVNQERGAVSLSLGQSQIRTADDQPLLAITKSVIGGGNALRGGYGCSDPAGVVAYAGKVFFPCRYRAELLRYDRNGLTPLGLTYKVRARLEAAFRLYASARISGCFDPRRKEYLLVFGATDTLPGLTLVYSDRYEAWSDELSMRPEAGLAVGNELISYQGGATWRHTPDAPQATFYGVYTAPQLTFTVAQPGGVAKQFKDVAIESASLWLATKLTTDTQLISRTLPAWFKLREGVYRAGLHRAENSPGFPTVFHALDNGRPLIGTRLTLTLTAPLNAAPLTAVSISQAPRSGQNMSA